MDNILYLSDITPGEIVFINEIKLQGPIRRRMQDIGLVKNTRVKCVGSSPLGDPKAFLIRGAVIAIRSEDCKNIFVTPFRV